MSFGHWVGDRERMGDRAVADLQGDYDRLLGRYNALVIAGDRLADRAGAAVAEGHGTTLAALGRALKDWRSIR